MGQRGRKPTDDEREAIARAMKAEASRPVTGEGRSPTDDEREAIARVRRLRGLDPLPDEGPSGWESAVATGLRVVPAVAGTLAGVPFAPVSGGMSVLAGGGAGSTLGEFLAQKYEQRNSGEEFDPNLAQLGIAGASGLMPWGSAARLGSTALRAALPKQLARSLPSLRAAPTGVLERLRHQAIRETAKGVSTGAPIAAIEGGASRYFQGQEIWDPEAIQRDLKMGALFGGALPALGAVSTKAAGIVAPSRGRGLGPAANRFADIHDSRIDRQNAFLAAKEPRGSRIPGVKLYKDWYSDKPHIGTEKTSVTASKFNIHGSQEKQLADIQRLLNDAEANVAEMSSQWRARYVKISDVKGVQGSLDKAFNLRKKVEGQKGKKYAKEINRIRGSIIEGPEGSHISVENAIKLKRLLDKELSATAFDPTKKSTVPFADLENISNEFRADLKTQAPPIADVLNAEKRLIDLQLALSKYSGKLTLNDFLYSGIAGGIGGFGLGGGPLGTVGSMAAGVGVRYAAKSPRFRSSVARAANYLAGNPVEAIPPVVRDVTAGPPPPQSSRWGSGEYTSNEGAESWTNQPRSAPRGADRQQSSRSRTSTPRDEGRTPPSGKRQAGYRPGSSSRRTEPPPPPPRTMPRTRSQAYTVLGVSPDATADQVKKAWRDLSRKHHPDTIPPPKTTGTMKDIMGDKKAMKEYMAKMAKYKALQQAATERMKEINAAWDLLKR